MSELGLVTTSGKVALGKMAQVTNNPELDGCVNLCPHYNKSFSNKSSHAIQ